MQLEMDSGMFKVGAFTLNLTGDCNPELSGAVTVGDVYCHSCDMLVQHKPDGMLCTSLSRCSRALGTVVLRQIQGLCSLSTTSAHTHTQVSLFSGRHAQTRQYHNGLWLQPASHHISSAQSLETAQTDWCAFLMLYLLC